MNVELERQLAEYGRQIDLETRPLDSSDIHTNVTRVRTRRPGWAVAVAAAVVVLVVLGGIAVLLVPGGGQAPVVDTPDPDPVTPTSVITPTTLGEVDSTPIPGVEGSIFFVARWTNAASGIDRTEAVWYLDAGVWRWETLESRSVEADGATELEGYILIRESDSMFEYLPIPNTFTILDPTVECADSESSPDNCVFDGDFDPTADGSLFYPTEHLCDDTGTCVEVGDGDIWEECSISDGGLVAGVATTRYLCSRPVIVNGVTETESLDLYQHESSRTMKLDLVVFQEIGQRDVIQYEILEIDLAPSFNLSLFEFKCPTDGCRDSSLPPDPFNHQMIGQVAPTTSGELLRGGSLDLADLRGDRIVFNLWASWCGPCTDELATLQTVSKENPDARFITGLVVDNVRDALEVMNDLGISMTTLDLTEVPTEDSFSDSWGGVSAIPTTFFIDEEGVIVAVQTIRAGEETLKEILDQLGW